MMQSNDECIIEQHKGNKLFLASMNQKYFFWVALDNDPDWMVDFWYKGNEMRPVLKKRHSMRREQIIIAYMIGESGSWGSGWCLILFLFFILLFFDRFRGDVLFSRDTLLPLVLVVLLRYCQTAHKTLMLCQFDQWHNGGWSGRFRHGIIHSTAHHWRRLHHLDWWTPPPRSLLLFFLCNFLRKVSINWMRFVRKWLNNSSAKIMLIVSWTHSSVLVMQTKVTIGLHQISVILAESIIGWSLIAPMMIMLSSASI